MLLQVKNHVYDYMAADYHLCTCSSLCDIGGVP